MMQQTETYNLNLIESSDTFSPAPLNENAQKLEAAIAAETAARAAETAALDQRVQVLELHHIAAGSYRGNAETSSTVPQIIELGFKPMAVIMQERDGGKAYFALHNAPHTMAGIKILDNGFSVQNTSRIYSNYSAYQYTYIAFA